MAKNITEDKGARQCNNKCDNCGKMPQYGHHVSHSNIKTNRRFKPNLQSVRHQTPEGRVLTLKLCTRCIRSGAVTKPSPRNYTAS